jgi:thiazole synthase
MNTPRLVIAGREYRSRLIVGTGKYASLEQTRRALEASGAELVTVAVRRVKLGEPPEESLLSVVDPKKYVLLPNTAGCYTVEEAVRTARLAREAGLSSLIKLEVIGDQATLFPDTEGLVQATRVLVKEGFTVLPYTNSDLVVARKLRDAGAAAVMPLAAPIGSGLGIQDRASLRILIEQITDLPIIVDAGVGTASDASICMELGADGVLMNTGIAGARDPIKMAAAMRLAVESGRLAFEAGRIPKKLYATASSPVEGTID